MPKHKTKKKYNPKNNTACRNRNRKSATPQGPNPIKYDDSQVWRLAGGHSDQFYAAAFFFETLDSRRSWIPLETRKKLRYKNHNDSDTTCGQLLDQIAVLFARGRNLRNNKNGGDAWPLNPVHDVTATAMSNNPSIGHEMPVSIYIAKNGGPQCPPKMISDVDFGIKVLDWYNKLDPNNVPTPPNKDTIWEAMQDFWYYQHRYHVDEITRLRFKPTLSQIKAPQSLIDISKPLHTEPRRFLADWDHVQKLIKWLSEERSSLIHDGANLKRFVNRICLEDTTPWELLYRKPIQRDDALSGLEDFRKIIKHFNMLKTIHCVWKSFVKFASEYPGVKISFTWLPQPILGSISKQRLEDGLKKGDSGHCDERFKQTLGDTRDRLKHLSEITRYFHCELQLLQLDKGSHLLPSDCALRDEIWGISSYIGCSKLSCFLCWRVLQKFGFATKNTHGKLRVGCAFPLDITHANTRVVACQSLKEITNEVLDAFKAEKSRQAEGVARYCSDSDSEPASSQLLGLADQPSGASTSSDANGNSEMVDYQYSGSESEDKSGSYSQASSTSTSFM